jgi:naphthoate synthase
VYTDILYEVREEHACVITIDRPERMNSFTAHTVEEMIAALKRAWSDDDVRCVILTGSGDRAFCAGGDIKQRAETGDYGPSENGLFEDPYLHTLIRSIPKPVIAAVNGVAIGGGHVLHVICDLSIAAERAQFGQAGPRVGSFDGGFGAAYLARVVGEKRAREIWFLLRMYSAAEALEWGLVNRVVPNEELMGAALEWATTISSYSATAIQFLKHAFNADTAHQAGFAALSNAGLDIYQQLPEARERLDAFLSR